MSDYDCKVFKIPQTAEVTDEMVNNIRELLDIDDDTQIVFQKVSEKQLTVDDFNGGDDACDSV